MNFLKEFFQQCRTWCIMHSLSEDTILGTFEITLGNHVCSVLGAKLLCIGDPSEYWFLQGSAKEVVWSLQAA
jgi:hypothetical protein